jgi:hypothetical protein
VGGKTLQIIHFKASVALVVPLLLLVVTVPFPVWATETDALTAITSAKNAIVNCYNAAQQAEAAGANITTLTDTLNQAGSLLSKAEFAYAMSDYDAALNLAIRSENSLGGYVAEASALQETAARQQNQDFLINVAGSIIGTFAIILSGFIAWRFLKKKYDMIIGVPTSEASRL